MTTNMPEERREPMKNFLVGEYRVSSGVKGKSFTNEMGCSYRSKEMLTFMRSGTGIKRRIRSVL